MATGKSSPVVEADPPTAVPATEATLPPVWRTTQPLPAGWLQPIRMPPVPADLVLAAAAHDAAEFRAEQTAEHAAQLRRELELSSAQQQAEAVEAKARAEGAKERRRAAAQARHRAAAVTRQEARAAEAKAKLERGATRAEEAKREAMQKKLRYEEARQRCRPQTEHRSIGTARLTTKLRTPSPPPHYASPRKNATDHVLRAAPTTAALVALARATLTTEGRTPVALTSSSVYRATSGRHRSPPGGHAGGATVRTTDPTTFSSLPPTPRPKVGVLPASALLSSSPALVATTAVLVAPATMPTTQQVANEHQHHEKKDADSSSAASMPRLPSADLGRRTPDLGPWAEPAQSLGGGAFCPGAVTAAAEGASDRARSVAAANPPPRTLARSCSPRQVNIHGTRRQCTVTGPPSPASVRTSMVKREAATAAATAAAAAAVARGGRWHSKASSPRGSERFYMSRSIAKVHPQSGGRSQGHRTAHVNGRRGVGVYATAVDTSLWLGDELEPAPVVAF